jgi:hypothetical protein
MKKKEALILEKWFGRYEEMFSNELTIKNFNRAFNVGPSKLSQFLLHAVLILASGIFS